MDEGEQRYNGYGILGWLNDLSSRRTLKTVNGAIKHNRYQLRMVEDLLDTDDRLIGIWTAKGRLYASRSQIFSFVPDSEDVMELNRQLAHESYETALRLKPKALPGFIDVREIQCRGAACCARSGKAFAVSENNTIFCGYQ